MPRTDAIRIRAAVRDGASETRNPREAFWAPLRNSERFQSFDIAQLEATLCRKFGGELRSALLDHLSEGLRRLDSDLLPGGLREVEHFLFRYLDGPREYRYQFAEAFTRYLEHRQDLLRESAAFRKNREQVAAAAGILFSTRISGYASLNFDLSIGSFSRLSEAFDGNFDSFRVFLEAFVPVAFGEVFDESFADRIDFSVSIPSSVERAFDSAAAAEIATQPPATATVGPPAPVTASPSAARERAEWLWRLANGSLLIPVVIALVVLFYGAQLLLDIRDSQNEALQPILQHQLELLKEDRLRMGNPAPQSPAPPLE